MSKFISFFVHNKVSRKFQGKSTAEIRLNKINCAKIKFRKNSQKQIVKTVKNVEKKKIGDTY